MSKQYLTEKEEIRKIEVVYSYEIMDHIDLIDAYNQNNIDALSRWHEYIDGIKDYLSFRDVAFDKACRCQHYRNGVIRLLDFGYNVEFYIGVDNDKNENYVCVLNIDLKLDEFGLKDPLAEGKSHMNRFQIYLRECVREVLNESQESTSISQAVRLAMQRLNYSKEEAEDFVRIKLRNDIPTLRDHKAGKFILGATRMFLDGQIRDAQTINSLNKTLKYVASDAHINEYDRNLNGISAQDLIDRFAKNVEDDLENDKNEVNAMEFNGQSDYDIVRIDSFEEAEEYGEYTSWCITHDERMFNSYTSGGINQFYFCLRKGFESVEEVAGEDAPLDEYGLSMIAVCVDEKGSLSTCTCRWNHENGGNDNVMGTKQISEAIGQNFYQVFKPNNKWNERVAEAMQRLKNGENPYDVFDKCLPFHEGFAAVELNSKWNWIDKQGNLLSPNQWFDNCGDFNEGFAAVRLNYKCNFIDKQGNLLSPNQWFNYGSDFNDGIARVELNGKWNFIDKQGNLLFPNQWFDGCGSFREGFAVVVLNSKYNFIGEQGNLLIPNQWFDGCGDFIEGYAAVKLNGKCNFIDTKGNLLFPNLWFDYCDNFYNGFAAVWLNWKRYRVDKQGNFYDYDTKEPIPSPIQRNESIRMSGQPLMETRFRRYLNRLVGEALMENELQRHIGKAVREMLR